MRPSIRRLLPLVLLLLCLVPRAHAEEEEEEGGEEGDPAQVAVGERLFLETRF